MTQRVSAYLKELDEALPYPIDVRRQVVSEAHDHLLSIAATLMTEGIPADEAEDRAVDIFGSVDDFLARFEAEGGPTATDEAVTYRFGIAIGCYAGITLGFALSPIFYHPLAIAIGLIVGTGAGMTSLLRHNPGPTLGAALGIVIGEISLQHYLISTAAHTLSDDLTILLSMSLLTGALGAGIGFLPRLRRDPSVLLWSTSIGLGFYLVARNWLEDSPTMIGVAALLIGLLIGGIFSLHPVGRRLSPVSLGSLLGLLIGVTLISVEQLVGSSILYTVVDPGVALTACAVAGAALGSIYSARDKAPLI